MKKGETPKLDYKWWSKNKAKTMKKSGLGKAIQDYEVAVVKDDPQLMLDKLSEVKKKVVKAIDCCNKKLHAETIEALKKFPGVIQKQQKVIEDRIKREKDAASAPAQPPKQKIGKDVVIWKRDISAEVLKKYKPEWLTDFKDVKLALKLNDDILDVLEAEGDLVTPAYMAEDAEEVGKELTAKLVEGLKHIDASSKGKSPQQRDKLREKFDPYYKQHVKAAGQKLQKIPEARWKKFVSQKKQYRDYKIKAGLEVTLGVLGTAGAAAGIVGSGGAGLALGIVALVRSVAALAKQIHDLARDAEGVEKALEKDLNVLMKSYMTASGEAKKSAGAKEMGGTVLKSILGTDAPFLATLPKCSSNYDLWDNKVAGLSVAGRKFSSEITKGLQACDKLEAQIKGSTDKNARKVLEKLRKARKSLDEALNNCSTMMGRVSGAEKNMPKLKKMLDALNSNNPPYAKIFDSVFPAVVNLTLSGASAGVGFKEASSTLETFNTALGLFNDIASEGKDKLEEYLG